MHHQATQDYLVSIIGKDYVGFDCYDVAKGFYKSIFDIDLNDVDYEDPDNKQEIEGFFNIESLKFKQVKEGRFGDIIVFRVLGLASHIGIYLGDKRFLHTTRRTNCVTEDITNWKRRIVGFYRWPSLDIA